MAKRDLLLNHIFLKNRIAELGLKQWWMAEQIGVDKKTVIRWIQGQVKSIQFDNAESLAKILECDIHQISLENEAEKFATAEDQKAAAEVLVSSSLMDKLGPIGEWDVIESLLKATIVPNLPLNILGEVYDQLTIASWRQSKIDQASLYNVKAEEIANKTQDRVLLASVLLSKANIYSWRGQTNLSIEAYKKCLDLEKYIEPRTLGSIYSNLGGVMYESGDFDNGEKYNLKALDFFQLEGQPINFSICHCHLAIIYLRKKLLNLAEKEIELSIKYANQDSYRRGQIQGKLLLAELSAHRNDVSVVHQLVTESLEEYAAIGIFEGLYFEQAGRCYRLINELSQAKLYLNKGIEISNEFPVYQAALYFELALVLEKMKTNDFQNMAQKAISLYQRCQCPLKISEIKNHFCL